MLFFKYYDPAKEKIHYMGHMYVAITSKVSTMVPELITRAHLPPGKCSWFSKIVPKEQNRAE